MADIFDEVNEDLRAERARTLLLRYGGLLVAAAVIVVAAAGGWQAWRWYQTKQARAVGETYFAAARLADPPTAPAEDRARAIAQFEQVAQSGHAGYRTLARLRTAALKADAGDRAGALALWDQVAGDAAADPLLRDLASLLWAQRQIDTGDPAVLQARLKPLTASENAWHGLAREASALIDLRAGRTAEARDALERLSADDSVPDGVRERAGGVLAKLDE